MVDFDITNETIAVLGVTTYLLGLAIGSIIVAPLSEMYGRRPVYIVTQILFVVMIIPCALAQNLGTILGCRFVSALSGSAMIANSPGTLADIVDDEYRALAFSIWSIGPMQGPNLGPIIGGFVFEYLGWRWTNWVVVIWAGVSFALLFMVKETYAPKLLRSKAQKVRKETGDSRFWSRYDERKSFQEILKLNMARPFVMMVSEPICIFWNVYIGILYAVLYLCFVAYPIVFSQERHWSPGLTGLGYLGIGIGCLITICSEPLIRRVINNHAPDPTTGKPRPEAMISPVCVGAMLVPIGELIFAWTCTPNVHWIAPIIAGIPFGAGNCAVFIYASNYLVHSYGVFAASALSGNAVWRSVLGATLPLAGPKLYETLGSNWAGTLLGCLELVLVPIPFVFYRYGSKIRERSVWIRKLRADQERLENKRNKAKEAEQARMPVEETILEKDETKV
jgi:multidrug resistance protein